MISIEESSLARPTVSVVIPVFNAEDTLKTTLDSIIHQSFTDFEIIAIDDCSQDNSSNILTHYASSNSKLKVIRNIDNVGAAISRNIGINASNGKYIAFIDSDDIWYEQKLEYQVSFMEQTKYPISYTSYTMINHDNSKREVYIPSQIDYRSLLKSCFIGFLTSALNVDILGKRYFRKLRRREDYVFWLDILREGYLAGGINKNLAIYNQNNHISNKLNLAKHQWYVYKDIIGMPYTKSLYYFFNYCFYGFKRNCI